MGATFAYRVYEKMSIDKVKKKWNQDVKQSLYENGHQYSGDIGMLGQGFIMKSKVKSLDDAITYIEDHHEKWNRAICVPYPEGFAIGGWCSS